jgi:hypothetical protein
LDFFSAVSESSSDNLNNLEFFHDFFSLFLFLSISLIYRAILTCLLAGFVLHARDSATRPPLRQTLRPTVIWRLLQFFYWGGEVSQGNCVVPTRLLTFSTLIIYMYPNGHKCMLHNK